MARFPFILTAAWQLLAAGISNSHALAADSAPQLVKAVEFARIDDLSLKLDLHLPATSGRTPIIVWVHGGAWRSGSRDSMPLQPLLAAGFPVASVDYRLSTQARFPAQIHDIKAAIRFLRSSGGKWKLDTRRIVVAGDSAGGHLAALTGVSNDSAELEGSIGSHLTHSSSVQGIISFYGGANLATILQQSTPHGLSVRIPALDLLLGGQPESVPALARLASPVFHVDAKDPPLLLLHGDQDPQMPVNQALELDGKYRSVGAPVRLEIVHGAAHGGDLFYDSERMRIVREFLGSHFPEDSGTPAGQSEKLRNRGLNK